MNKYCQIVMRYSLKWSKMKLLFFSLDYEYRSNGTE